MITDYTLGKVILAAFALACAWQDIRAMSITYKTVMAGIAAALLGMMVICIGCGISPAETIVKAMMGSIPGGVLLMASRLTGQIGIGDGLYFIIVGVMMGLRDTVVLMVLSLFANALISAGILTACKMSEIGRSGKDLAAGGLRSMNVLKKRMPFLPAAGAVLMWMLMR